MDAESVGSSQTPPLWGWVGAVGATEEQEAEFLFKGFSILIFCDSSSVLEDGFLCQP